MRYWLTVLFCGMLLLGNQLLQAQCNGDPLLCAKRYDEVCYVTTHNAFNYQGPFILPNQTYSVAQQLADGVRGLMLDVYWLNNEPTVYHGTSFLGNQPLADLLADIKTFLDSNTTEVVTIIFECDITSAQMDAVFSQSGLLSDVHTQTLGQSWPTLGDMIAANRRLVVFTDKDDGQAYPWYHYVWDYAVETHFTNHSRSDFTCDYNRGDSANSLFILNHFISEQTLGTGMKDSAMAVNANPYLTSRAMNCWATTGKIPNFLTVDFYEVGDVMAAKDQLNAGFVGNVSGSLSASEHLRVMPNPVSDEFVLQVEGRRTGTFTLYDLQGRVQMAIPLQFAGDVIRFPVPEGLGNGLYFWRWESGKSMAQGKVIVGQ